MGVKPVEVLTQSISMKDFMQPGFEKGRYNLKPYSFNQQKYNFMKKVDYFGKELTKLWSFCWYGF